jgi:hypothetical protein
MKTQQEISQKFDELNKETMVLCKKIDTITDSIDVFNKKIHEAKLLQAQQRILLWILQ